jgi:Domain of unknown function (DUF4258)
MQTFEEVQEQCLRGEMEFSTHALNRMNKRTILAIEVMEAIHNAECIKVYPRDKYGACMLLLGFTNANRPLHIVITAFERPRVKIITAYQPDPNQWENFRTRKE